MTCQSIFIPSLLSKKISRIIHFEDRGLLLENTISKRRPMYIPWTNISGIKVHSSYIYGLYFPIGREYAIELKCDDNTVHSINLQSFYAIKKNKYKQLWNDLFQLLFRYHFQNLLNYYLELASIGQLFTLADVNIDVDGVSWENEQKVLWDNMAIYSYTRYAVISNKSNPRQKKFLYYGKEWNAYLLQVLLSKMLNTKSYSLKSSRMQK